MRRSAGDIAYTSTLTKKSTSIGETRIQLELEKDFDFSTLKLTADFPYDSVPNSHHLRTEKGKGFIDLREASFAFSPSDRDAYLRPRVHYKIDDHWSVTAGANILLLSTPHTFFGQFEKNSNLYFALRCGF